MMRAICRLQATVLVAACAAGCADLDESNGDLEELAVGETRQELGEVGCGVVAITPGSAQGTILPGQGHCAWTSSSVSPDAEYGSTSCPGQYLVEFTGTGYSSDARPFVSAPDPLGQFTCETARLEMGVYGQRPVLIVPKGDLVSIPDGGFVAVRPKFALVGTRVLKGQWIPEVVSPPFTFPAHCSFVTVSDAVPSDWKVSNHAAIRVAGRATRITLQFINGQVKFVRTPMRVVVGLRGGHPC